MSFTLAAIAAVFAGPDVIEAVVDGLSDLIDGADLGGGDVSQGAAAGTTTYDATSHASTLSFCGSPVTTDTGQVLSNPYTDNNGYVWESREAAMHPSQSQRYMPDGTGYVKPT
ncbi:MAG: hypothetical protein PVI21_05785 [Candidatus Woesebacteria bacterium]|jgi:hypothetical protein